MKTPDWKSALGAVAPAIATALGGPLAGTAVSALSRLLLGKEDGTEAELAAVVGNADPATLLKLKELDQQFARDMAALEVDLERIAASDRDSARRREAATGDHAPKVIAALVVICYGFVQWYLLTHVVPQEMREIVMRTLGTLDAALGMVLAYYFGSSAGSKAKDRIIEGMKRGG